MEPLGKAIDILFADYDHTNTPGCALAVLKDGEVAYQRCYGMANLEHGVPIQPTTRFQIGSISKHFTAMCILLLEKEGKLKRDDDIRLYLPEMPAFEHVITIRHLMHHLSGLRGLETLNLAGWREDDILTMEDTLEIQSRQREMNTHPGEQYSYCNPGYVLLALIVQRVSGMPIHAFAEARLFKPLGMKDSLLHHDYHQVIPRFCSSYQRRQDGSIGWMPLLQPVLGSTGLITTLHDLSLWDEAFYKGTVVGMDVIDRMHERGRLNSGQQIPYACGLRIGTYRGLKTVSHGGVHAGFRAQLLRFPEQHVTIILLSNFGALPFEELSTTVADLFLAESFTQHADPGKGTQAPIELSEAQLEERAGVYLCGGSRSVTRLVVKDGHLCLALGPGIPLEAVSESRMRVVSSPQDVLQFERNAAGHLRLHRSYGEDGAVVSERVEAWVPASDDFSEFIGTYYCPELDYSHEIRPNHGQLAFAIRKQGLAPMTPTLRDSFCADLTGLWEEPEALDLHFERDGLGNLIGFRLFSSTIRRLRFEKRS